jgi:DNA-binding XRE family transcriptional regulator
MEGPAKRLAKNLRKWRGDQSLRDYAKKLGISKSTLGSLENENQNTTLHTLTALAKALRCDIGDLFK